MQAFRLMVAKSVNMEDASMGKFTQKMMLISDDISDRREKSTVDRFSISLLVPKICAFKDGKLNLAKPVTYVPMVSDLKNIKFSTASDLWPMAYGQQTQKNCKTSISADF